MGQDAEEGVASLHTQDGGPLRSLAVQGRSRQIYLKAGIGFKAFF